MDTEDKDRDVLKAISIMSFGAFALVAVVVIALVSGEDFLSGVDFGGGKKKKK